MFYGTYDIYWKIIGSQSGGEVCFLLKMEILYILMPKELTKWSGLL